MFFVTLAPSRNPEGTIVPALRKSGMRSPGKNACLKMRCPMPPLVRATLARSFRVCLVMSEFQSVTGCGSVRVCLVCQSFRVCLVCGSPNKTQLLLGSPFGGPKVSFGIGTFPNYPARDNQGTGIIVLYSKMWWDNIARKTNLYYY